MREGHEIRIELQHGEHSDRAHPSRLLTIAAVFVGGIVAAFLCMVLLAHPAGATRPAAPNSTPAAATPAVAGVPTPALPVVSTIAEAIGPELQALGSDVAGSAAVAPLRTATAPVVTKARTLTAPILGAVSSVATPLTAPIEQSLTPVVAPVLETLTQALAPLTNKVPAVGGDQPTGANGLSPTGLQAAPADLSRGQSIGRISSGGSAPAPSPHPTPFPPSQRFPLVTSTPSGESVPVPGSNALAVNLRSGLLLPDLAISRIVPEQSKTTELLFDLRYSPPG